MLRAVLWKEWREQCWMGGPRKQLWYSLALGALFAVGATVGFGLLARAFNAEFDEPGAFEVLQFLVGVAPWLGSGFAAILTPLGVVLDAVAGERERHTWETLLAKPIPLRSIIGGKVLAMVLAALMVFSTGMLGAVIAPFFGGMTAVLGTLSGFAVIGFGVAVGAFAFASSGIWMSRRARTVKEGQQRMALMVMPVSMAPAIFPLVAFNANPIVGMVSVVGFYIFLVTLYLGLGISAFMRLGRDRMVMP